MRSHCCTVIAAKAADMLRVRLVIHRPLIVTSRGSGAKGDGLGRTNEEFMNPCDTEKEESCDVIWERNLAEASAGSSLSHL